MIMSLFVACGMAVSTAFAKSVEFIGASGDLKAQATFEANGDQLIVTLANIADSDVFANSGVLTALLFETHTPVDLQRVSAVLGDDSVMRYVSGSGTDPNNPNSVGGEWAYKSGLTGTPGGADKGISSTGMGDFFGPKDRFSGANLDGPASPGGLEYGLLSAGDNLTTGNKPLLRTPLIQHEVVFTLSGLPVGFDPAQEIYNVWFNYGTSANAIPATPMPLPAAVWSGMALLAGLYGGYRCRKARRV